MATSTERRRLLLHSNRATFPATASSRLLTSYMTSSRLRVAACVMAVVLWLALMGLTLSDVALAQAPAPAGNPMAVQPTQFTIAGVRDDMATRSLLLLLPPGVQQVRFVPQDLASTAGTQVLPATNLQASLPATLPVAGGPVTMTVTVSLQGVVSGAYTGQALLTYGDDEQWLSFTVAVKDPMPLPLLITVVGIGIGMWMTYYRQRAKPRDELVLHLHQVELALAGDGELGEKANGQSFRERVLRYVAMAQTAMRSEQWETARTAVSQADQVLDLWHSQRMSFCMRYWLFRTLCESASTSHRHTKNMFA